MEENYTSKVADLFNRKAHLYQQRFMEMDLYDETYDALLELITNDHSKVLDAGCGPGNISKYLLDKKPKLDVLGIDLSENMLRLARENNPEAEFMIYDCKEIKNLNRKFDAIVCGFCLPYLSKEETAAFISDCSSLLTKNGILYLSAIEDKNQNSRFETSSDGKDTMFVNYHEGAYLEEFITNAKLRIVNSFRKQYEKPTGEIATHIVLISSK